MRTIVCGATLRKQGHISFRYRRELVWECLDNSPFPISTLLSGKGSGVAQWAEMWAAGKIPIESYPPHWQGNTKDMAVAYSNHELAKHADALIAFPGEFVRVENQIAQAELRDLYIWRPLEDNWTMRPKQSADYLRNSISMGPLPDPSSSGSPHSQKAGK